MDMIFLLWRRGLRMVGGKSGGGINSGWGGVGPQLGVNFSKSTALAKAPSSYPDIAKIYIISPPPPTSLLFSLALFAFWLRSSVVSVLFSLISEILLRKKSMIKFIFVTREESSGLAHDSSHCVPGLTLPPGDANF